ncbi:hyaluronidase NagK [Clostridium perfringens]|uniref:hyaluronidase NagK n=2 Tax=Clostridium perfringens TaxID=1502 RepID=UPI000D7115F6|nr:hyaluronidase NagK [Clostridium perfringens]PWX76171.1 hyaluronidase [Clostridium perfringens]
MRKKGNKLIEFVSKIMAFVMAVTLLSSLPVQNVLANESKETKGEEYEIYPIPQSIKYDNGTVTLGADANVVFEEGIDEATKNRLLEVLSIKGINYEESNEIKEDKTNFLIGINNSEGVVDKYFTDNNLANDSHFENHDAHVVSVKGNVIAVLGKNTDSAFYGITSLKAIFNQLEGNELKELLIEDYSDGQWRGFIEGYYGIPWSNENRKDLMKFGGDFKMNSYIFAPKDDQYHSLKWREPYPAEKLAEIKEMVDVGIATKNKFIWTIHPFLKDGMNFGSEESYKADLEKIIAKFEQLYSVGVRQFGVLADDAEGEANNQVKLMEDLEKWRLQKGDVYEFIFVPKVYTKESAGGYVNNEYLKTIGTMPETIDIMWTGDVILGYVTQETFEFFEEAVGRQAFMWLNWPVNDINNKRLLMGKGEMLDPTVTNFKGIVTNPMQEAQASKVALFAIADYGWNRADFDMDKSWKDSFKYIEPDASEELYTFAKHMSDPAPNWHGLSLEESEELRPVIEEFTRRLWEKESVLDYSKVILDEYQEILDATNNFATKSKNELLKSEIKGWVDSLRDLAESTIAYINSAVAFEKGNYEEAMKYYVLGEEEYTDSRSHRTPVINGQSRPEPGIRHLIPFIKDLSKIIGDNIDQVINPDTTKLTLRPYTNMSPLYWGHVQNIADGDNTRYSCMWIRNSAKEGDYVAVELNEVTKVNSITFEQGQDEGDAFNYGKFQYSMDGENWTDVDGVDYGPKMHKIVVEDLDLTAKYLRFIPTKEILNNWIAVREFSVNKKDENNMKVNAYTNVEALAKNEVSISEEKATLSDLNDVTLSKGEYVGIKLNKLREVTNIVSDFTNNDNLTLETSINGVEWVEAKTLSETINARYVRIINNTDKDVTFNLNKLEAEYSNNDVNFDIRPTAEAKFEPKNLIDGKLNTAFKPLESAPKSGQLTYRISDKTDIKKFTIVQNPNTISNAIVSIRNENGWKEIGSLGKSFNEFNTEDFENVFEIKVEWDGFAPTIYEIGLSTIKEEVQVDKSKLEEAIKEVEKLKEEDYTKDSWSNLIEKLNLAKEVLSKEDATQDEVDNAIKALNEALNGLVKKEETEGPVDPDKPEGPIAPEKPVDPENPEKPENPEGTDKPETPDKPEGNLPNTGGASSSIFLQLGVVMMASGAFVLKRKKR